MCGLTLKPKGVLLPTAPPGHSYAVGPRRGAYLVLQPVVDPDGSAVFPPARLQVIAVHTIVVVVGGRW